jgi:hypothetical protein
MTWTGSRQRGRSFYSARNAIVDPLVNGVPLELQYILIGVMLLANVALNRWRGRR